MSKELPLSSQEIENRIFTIRGSQVMIDRDLAELYGVETRALNQAVKRNSDRFPNSFRFQLNGEEFENWKSQNVISNTDKMGLRRPPFVFTEQGVAMLSAVLRSQTAVIVSLEIMNAFVALRKTLIFQSGILQRIEGIERKILESDQKFDKVFKALENKDSVPSQGVFFDGQVFDAYELASRIIRTAKKTIILIDNYINETNITHFAKKEKGVQVSLLTKTISKQLELDIRKANEQFGGFEAKVFDKSHDRFLIIDGQEIYHLGASLKDLGKKWFAFSRLEKDTVKSILDSIAK
ncbi:MAG: ORF6N domain-containing protein [Algoriphagus sp.]|uniref:ORF6N domain-containing protein n=1 Tax=Algoriphagus sp. TaxID=1872435 RepID=UPI00272FF3EA|nr:ORF6N domain-containing protein [Algoriphagus sp.]MDP2041887.1 ORF6N domain-containing protein [Algoriphagus sp.]MDP3473105.1 ORF6N domain-containing protein [Algoriphagus sp.]